MQFAEEGLLDGFRCVIDEIPESPFEGLGIGKDEGQAGCEIANETDGLQTACENS